jgi:hypothetical protein
VQLEGDLLRRQVAVDMMANASPGEFLRQPDRHGSTKLCKNTGRRRRKGVKRLGSYSVIC